MLTRVRTLFLVAAVAVVATSLSSAAPLESTNLDRRGASGQACLTWHAEDLCAGNCGTVVNPNGLPCIAIPGPIFFNPLSPSDPNQNPLCSKVVTLTKGTVVKQAIIGGANEVKPDQQCGLGSSASVDTPRALFLELGGDDGPLGQVSYSIES